MDNELLNIKEYDGEIVLTKCSEEATGDIVIPDGVTKIGQWAFDGCMGISSVSIPTSVTCIGEGAFAECGLSIIIIPNSVTCIGDNAFNGCTSLKSITIPKTITIIGSLAFRGCCSLESMIVEDGNTIYDSRSHCNAIIETATNTLIAGCKNTIIPNGVISIKDGAFDECGITSITIPSSVISIDEASFIRCNSIEKVVVESGNTVYDSRDNCNAIVETASNTLIVGCKNTIIPNDVTCIGDWAFDRCYDLECITVPSSVTAIGNFAFFECENLSSITIPDSVNIIGEYAFDGCNSLTDVIASHRILDLVKKSKEME